MEENLAVLENEFADEIAKGEYINRFDLIRGLQGHNNDVNFVKKLYRKHLRFMSSIDWEQFERHPVMHQYFPFGFVGGSGKNDDNFINIETVGRSDVEGVLNSVPVSAILLNRMLDLESMMKHLRRHEADTGRQARVLFLSDAEHFTLDVTQIVRLNKYFMVINQFFTEHYFEVIDRFLVVNAAKIVYYVWRLVKSVVPEKTRKKVTIFSNSDWRQQLLEYIVPDRLPAHWGGTMVDQNGDTMCRSVVVVPPGKVPTELYWRSTDDDKDAERELQHLPVPARNGAFVDVHVTADDLQKTGRDQPISLRWRFTTDGDFSFGVFFAESEQQPIDVHHDPTVYPFFEHLPGPTIVPEVGRILCRRPGWYKFRFGNETAWWMNLNVHYQITKC